MKTNKRIQLAKRALTGTAIGDAFGQSFFTKSKEVEIALKNKQTPKTNWVFTDDTVMSIPLLKSLIQYESINQDFIAKEFALNYNKEWNRGYGPSMHRKLKAIEEGMDWLELSKSSFNGEGSIGNGGAMRVALIGAYFYDDYKKVISETKKSCEITHYNLEAVAGAIAVAVSTAICTRIGLGESTSKDIFLDTLISLVPESATLYRLKKIELLPKNYQIQTIVSAIGDSTSMKTQDTVPFSIWNVYHYSDHYSDHFEDCLWSTVSGLGDRDTTCAIAGGISIMSSKSENVPQKWLNSVESWENSIFYKTSNNDRTT